MAFNLFGKRDKDTLDEQAEPTSSLEQPKEKRWLL